MSESQPAPMRRREFLGAAAAANLLLVTPQTARGSAANSAVRLGLLGCGGRGTGVTASFVETTGVRVTALGDLFPDALQAAKKQFDDLARKRGHAGVDSSHLFSGPQACEKLVNSKEVDAVYIATPVWWHPEHFEAAVAAGKHVYLEKPVAVDVPGVNRVLRAAEKGKGRINMTVGLQLRHASPYVELFKRVHGGAIGDIVCGLVHYYAGALPRPPWPGASARVLRVRDWVYDKALSGDIVVEQNVHVIDITNWALRNHPLRVTGACGRKGRTDHGNCSSHYDCVFTYPGDIHISFASTQFIKGSWDVAMRYFGTKGNSEAHYDSPVRIEGDNPWEFPGLGKPGQIADSKVAATGVFRCSLDDADANKQKHFIESITSGKLLYDIADGADSTLSAIMARQAAATGEAVTWEQMLRSEEVLESGIDLNKL